MRDVLQGLLYAEAARVGLAPVGVVFVLRPIGETALAESAHAIGLVVKDLRRLVRRHENQRFIGRTQG